MKFLLKLTCAALLVTAVVFGLATMTDEPVEAIALCPATECGSLVNATYVGPCTTGECLGWIYIENNQECYESALH